MAATNVQAFSGDIDIAGAITSNVEFGGSKFTYDNTNTTVFMGNSTATDNEIGVFNVGGQSSDNTFIDVWVVGTSGTAGNHMHYRVYFRPDAATDAFINTFERDNGGVLPVVYRTNAGNITGGVVRIGYEGAKNQYIKWRVEVSERYTTVGNFEVTNTGSAVDTTGLVQVTPVPATRLNSNLAVNVDTLFVDSTNSRVGIGVTNPDALLHLENTFPLLRFVNSRTNILADDDIGGITFYSRDVTGDGYPNYELALIKCVNAFNPGSAPDGELTFSTGRHTGGSLLERMRINADGNVGIGTNAPECMLHLSALTSSSNITDPVKIKIHSRRIASDWSTTQPWGVLEFDTDDQSAAGSGPVAGIGCRAERTTGGNGSLCFYTDNNNNDNTVLGLANERMCIDHDGRVGIGTTNPAAKFNVYGTAGYFTTSGASPSRATYFNNTSGLYINTSGDFGGVSIYANNDILAGGWVGSFLGSISASDERIKKEIVDVEDGEALSTLRLLKPKRYKYRDEVKRGVEPVWGFIAQEVRDTLPYATQTRRECIPTIYELANVSASNVITFTNFNTTNLESNATSQIKLFDAENDEHMVKLVSVLDEHSIQVEEDLTKWISSLDEDGNITEGNQIFVYGEEVNDFVFIQKDAIWTVATSALQEVDRQLQEEKNKVATLETQLASVLTRLDALESA